MIQQHEMAELVRSNCPDVTLTRGRCASPGIPAKILGSAVKSHGSGAIQRPARCRRSR